MADTQGVVCIVSRHCFEAAPELDLPVGYKTALSLAPQGRQVGEAGAIDYIRHRLIDLLPEFREGSLLLQGPGTARRRPALGSARARRRKRAFDEAQHLAYADAVGGAREQIAALGAAARFDEAALFELRQDQLQKFLRDLLAGGDFSNLDRSCAAPVRQIEDRLQRVVPFHRNVHAGLLIRGASL